MNYPFTGAKKVYAVECSNIADQCSAIIKDNGLSDVVEVIKAKMEDVTLPVEYVDIIISEWMGYFLLYESMLNTVLYARDKFLRPKTGIMLPDKAVLFICAIEDADYRRDKVCKHSLHECHMHTIIFGTLESFVSK